MASNIWHKKRITEGKIKNFFKPLYLYLYINFNTTLKLLWLFNLTVNHKYSKFIDKRQNKESFTPVTPLEKCVKYVLNTKRF